MRLLTLLMLGVLVPLTATGFAADEEAPQPEKAPPPQNPPRATGALNAGEELFQGSWQLLGYEADSDLGTMRVDGRAFHADGVHGEYRGYLSIRSGATPPQIDFTIETCDCMHEGKTSTGVYRPEDDGSIVFAGQVPGEPRPEGFDPDLLWRMRPLDPAR